MNADRATPASPDASPGAGAASEGLLQSLQALCSELPGLVSDRVELLSLELKRALLTLGQVAMLVVGAAILGVTAWLALWAIVIQLLVLLGLHWVLAQLAALLVNVAAAWWALVRARTLLHQVGLPATRRHLTLGGRAPTPSESDETHAGAERAAAG